MNPVTVTVLGTPAPQGSKKSLGNGRMVESSKRVKPWRQSVAYAAQALQVEPTTAAVRVEIDFKFFRPLSHMRTGKNYDQVKASAPLWPVSRAVGDLDKLCRATFDGLVDSGVIADDSQIVELVATKTYLDPHTLKIGAIIQIEEIQ